MTRAEFILLFSVTVITAGGLFYQFNFRYSDHSARPRRAVTTELNPIGVNGAGEGLPLAGEGQNDRGGREDFGIRSGDAEKEGAPGDDWKAEGLETEVLMPPAPGATFAIRKIERVDGQIFLMWEDNNRQAAGYRVFIQSGGETIRIVDAKEARQTELSGLAKGRVHIVTVASYDTGGLTIEKSKSAVVVP